jgi:hypothetical protein
MGAQVAEGDLWREFVDDKGFVAPDSTVWPPWARSRRRAVRLMVGPM